MQDDSTFNRSLPVWSAASPKQNNCAPSFKQLSTFAFHLWEDWRMICRVASSVFAWVKPVGDALQKIPTQTGGSRWEWSPRMTLSEAISCCENLINFLKERSFTHQMNQLRGEMWKGKKSGGKASRWHRQMFPKELMHNFPFTFYSSCCNKSCWQELLSFYKDFLVNKHFILKVLCDAFFSSGI